MQNKSGEHSKRGIRLEFTTPPPAALDAREMSLKEDMESTGYLAEESDLWSAAIGKAEIRVLILDDILRYAYT